MADRFVDIGWKVPRVLPMQAGVRVGEDGFCRMDAADLRTDHGMCRAKPTKEGAKGLKVRDNIKI